MKNVNDMYAIFMEHYELACVAYVPSRAEMKRSKQVPWLTKELKKKIKTKNILWYKNRSMGFKNTDCLSVYKELKKSVEKDIKAAIKAFEKDLSRKAKSNPKLLYSYVRKKQKVQNHIRMINSVAGDTVTDPSEISNSLNSYFHSVFVKEMGETLPDFRSRTEVICEDLHVNEQMVMEKLMKLNINKSAGVDGIKGIVLQKCASVLAYPLCEILNKSLRAGEVPSQWKNANITPLFKKGNKMDPSNYRGISLTSIICKLLEGFVKDKIINHLSVNNLLNQNQHGFTKGKSCVTNLLETVDLLTSELSKNNATDVVFIDFAKAFDVVPHKRLIKKLAAYGISGQLLKWIQAFLTDRKQRVVLGDCVSSGLMVLSGVPQGSVLGPLLFLIFINDLGDELTNIVKLYADDTKLLARVSNSSDTLQSDLNAIVTWCNTWQMSLNIGKCKIMHLGKNNPMRNYVLMSQDGTASVLEITTCEKDLGITITPDLKWTTHIANIASKANQILGMLKNTFSFFDVDMVRRLYTALVRPNLEFGATIWSPYLKKDIAILERIQHRATRLSKKIIKLPYEIKLMDIT
jgi:hypothetical protein